MMSDDLQQIVRAKEAERIQAVAEIKQVATKEISKEKRTSLLTTIIVGLGGLGFAFTPDGSDAVIRNVSTIISAGTMLVGAVVELARFFSSKKRL